MVLFNLKIAGIVFSVQCCFDSTRSYCRDFFVEENTSAQEEILITQDCILMERELLNGKKSAFEILHSSPDEHIEILVLCRKIAELMPKYNGVLFHGSALAFDDRGLLFTATSGTGKSTHSSIWRKVYGDRVRMINDDKPFIRLIEGKPYVFGSPWMGKHRLGGNLSVPLQGICILSRGKENQIYSVTPRDAMPILVQQCYRPENVSVLMDSMSILDSLSKNAGLYQIFCNMEDSAAKVVCEHIFLEGGK